MAIITASPKNMARMIELQESSLGQLETIRQIFERNMGSPSEQTATVIPPNKVQEQLVVTQKESLKLQKEDLRLRKEQLKQMDEDAAIISALSQSFKTFKSPLEKFKDSLGEFAKPFKTPGRTLMKTLNVGGIFNKQIAKSEFVEKQKDLGSTKSDKEIRADFEKANKIAKELQLTEAKLEKLKKSTGLSESKLAQTPQGRKLLDERAQGAAAFKEVDLAAQLETGTDKTSIPTKAPTVIVEAPSLAPSVGFDSTPSQNFASGAAEEEAQMENARLMNQQTELLQKIEENTRSGGGDAAKEGEGGGLGSGLMKGIGAGLKALGGGLGGLGKGLGKGIQGLLTGIARGIGAFGTTKVLKGAAAMVVLSGALYITGKALKEFAGVEWESVAKGTVAMLGLAAVGMVLGKAGPGMIIGAGAMLILSAALWVTGDALQKFQGLDWETIGKGMVAVAGLGVLGAVAGTAAPLLLAGSAALAALGGSLWLIGEAMQAVGAGFKSMTDGLERLSKMDGGALSKVGAGLVDIGIGMAAFGAGQAAAGLSTLVTNLLTIGQDSPVEQLVKIGEIGNGLLNASIGVKDLAEGIKAFAGVDEDSLDALDSFPWKKATEFVKAGGVIKMNGAVVASVSASAEMAKVNAVSPVGNGGTTVVNNSVNNSKNVTQVLPKSPARKQEKSWWDW